MAQVKINIPGIGTVDAENAASEDTLLKILAAMSSSGGAFDKKRQADEKKASDESIKSKKDETKAADNVADSYAKLTKAGKNATEEQEKSGKAAKDYSATLAESYSQISTATKSAVTGFAMAAVTLTAQLATSYNQMAANPIGAAAGLLNAGIDAAALAANKTVDVAAGAGKAAAGLLGPWASAGQGLVDATSAVSKAAIATAVVLAKTTNDIFASELKKTTESFQSFSKQGASFAGGMDEMRRVSERSGVELGAFTRGVSESSESIRGAGLSQAEGAKQIAGVMGVVSTKTGASGKTLRTEMDALGYSYQDQIKLVGQVMSLQAASGKKRSMTDDEMAAATKAYAIDLKVLADITGQNAQKAMEEAKLASMEGDIAAQFAGNADELAKFQAALAATPQSMKKGFLEFISSGGEVVTDQATNIAQAQGLNVIGQYQTIMDNIKNSMIPPAGFQTTVLSGFVQLGNDAKEMGPELLRAIRLGNLGGAIADAGKMINESLRMSVMKPEQVKESFDAAKAQSEIVKGTSAAVADLNSQTNDFAKQMQAMVAAELPAYSTLLAKTYKETIDAFKTGVDWIKAGMKIGGPDSTATGPAADVSKDQEMAAQLAAARDTALANVSTMDKMFGRFTKEQKAAIDAAAAAEAALKANPAYLPSAAEMSTGAGLGMASGGIIGAKRGGVPILAAEAGLNEAFVPLPDGKRIPIDMSSMADILVNIGNKGGGAVDEEFKRQLLENNNLVIAALKQIQNIYTESMAKNIVGAEGIGGLLEAMNTVVGVLEDSKYELQDQTSSLKKLYDATA